MRRLRAAVVALALAGALVACDDPHKGEHCVEMSIRLVNKPVYGMDGKVSFVLVNESYCKRWEKDAPR